VSLCAEPVSLLGPQNFELLLSSQVGIVDSELHAIPQSYQELPKSLLQVWLCVLQQCRDMRLIEDVNVVPFSRGGRYCLHKKEGHCQHIKYQEKFAFTSVVVSRFGGKSHLARAHRIFAAQT
jgi:hypothetical protein